MQAAKYYTGTYRICQTCGVKPCICELEVTTPARVVAMRAPPASGNAIPFSLWDTIIDLHQLTIYESGVLAYLCRRTIGYGAHGGDEVSIAEIAGKLHISRRQAARALDRLDACRLIERNRRHERGKREYAKSHLRVTLERE